MPVVSTESDCYAGIASQPDLLSSRHKLVDDDNKRANGLLIRRKPAIAHCSSAQSQ